MSKNKKIKKASSKKKTITFSRKPTRRVIIRRAPPYQPKTRKYA